MSIEDEIHRLIEAERLAVENVKVIRTGNHIRVFFVANGKEYYGTWKATEAGQKALAFVAKVAPKKRAPRVKAEPANEGEPPNVD